MKDDNVTFLEFCERLDLTKDCVRELDHKTFDSLVEVFHKGRIRNNLKVVQVTPKKVVYVDGQTGEEVFEKSYKNAFVDFTELRTVASLTNENQLEQLRNDMKIFPIEISKDGIDFIASLNKTDSLLIKALMDNLVKGNCGVIRKDFVRDLVGYKNFYKRYSVIRGMKVLSEYKTGLGVKYLGYQIAPYLAYRGPESHKDSAINNWITKIARENSKLSESIDKVVDQLPERKQESQLTGKLLVSYTDNKGATRYEIVDQNHPLERFVTLKEIKFLGDLHESTINPNF